MNFSDALIELKRGKRIVRRYLGHTGAFIFIVAGSTFAVNREPLLSILGEGHKVNYNPHIDIKHPDGSISTWTPTVDDLLADDWINAGQD